MMRVVLSEEGRHVRGNTREKKRNGIFALATLTMTNKILLYLGDIELV